MQFLEKHAWQSMCILLLCVMCLPSCAKPDAVPGEAVSFEETQIHLDALSDANLPAEAGREKGHIQIDRALCSEYSIGYQNQDGTRTLYLYSTPIHYQTSDGLRMIDARIRNTIDSIDRSQGYVYTVNQSDIKAFFHHTMGPQGGIRLKKGTTELIFTTADGKQLPGTYGESVDFIGQSRAMIRYDADSFRLKAYPTTVGANCEVDLNAHAEHDFLLRLNVISGDVKVQKQPGGYWTLYQTQRDETGKRSREILGVIQPPLLRDAQGRISYQNNVQIKSSGKGEYLIRFTLDPSVDLQNATAYIALEMRREKLPDNSIYSGKPRLKNAYLSNYTVLGQSDAYGVGRLMIRYFVKNCFPQLKAEEIIAANQTLFSLTTSETGSAELVSVLEDWCSMTGNWRCNFQTGERIASCKMDRHQLEFDITAAVRQWCSDDAGTLERYGLQMRMTDENGGESHVVLTNDNTLFPNVVEIQLQPK